VSIADHTSALALVEGSSGNRTGRLGSIPGTVLGGLLIGLVEALYQLITLPIKTPLLLEYCLSCSWLDPKVY